MKSKGSKSSQLLRSKQIYQQRLNQLTTTLDSKTHQLLRLKSKITQSKPILQTILHKVKLKQDHLETELIITKRKLVRAEENSNRKSKINLETMRFVKDMVMMKNYDLEGRTRTQNDGEGLGNGVKNSKRFFQQFTRQRENREERRKEEDIEKSSPPKPVRTQHTYNQYQSKLDKARINNQNYIEEHQNKNRLKQKLRQVSKELRSGIDTIKKVRQEFKHVQNALISKGKWSKSETRIKMPRQPIQGGSPPPSLIDPEKARRFLQNKQRRLDLHRNT